MRRWATAGILFLMATGITACNDRSSSVTGVRGVPDAPRAFDGWYYDRAVYLVWDLQPGWDGESFRIYGRRTSDARWYRLAEVTSCTSGTCSYTDVNLVSGVTYEYYVVAVDPTGGAESPRSYVVDVYVPEPVPPPPPAWSDALALDGGVYLRWDAAPASEADFSFYRVYLVDPDGGEDFLLGETDSPAYLDERAVNGSVYTYRMSAVDDQGHESVESPVSSAIPRPDYHGEWVWAYQDRPEDSGFRFRASEEVDPVVSGDDPDRHFRFEVDADGWWIVPGPSAELYQDAFATTELRCGPGSDASCVELSVAPETGYGSFALELLPESTYVLRVGAADGSVHYGAVHVDRLGVDQSGDPIMVFDWSYQLAPGSLALSPRTGVR